jgi:hypothetical protein
MFVLSNCTKLCRIWGSHSGGYREFYLLGYNDAQLVESQPTFRSNISPLLLPDSPWFFAWLILRPSKWRRHIPPKRQLTSNGLQGVYAKFCWLAFSVHISRATRWPRIVAASVSSRRYRETWNYVLFGIYFLPCCVLLETLAPEQSDTNAVSRDNCRTLQPALIIFLAYLHHTSQLLYVICNWVQELLHYAHIS